MSTGATGASGVIPASQAAAAGRAAAVAGALSVPADSLLLVAPGQALAARVLAAADGLVELALAGGRVSARTDVPLAPGQTIALVVDEAASDRVTLRISGNGGAAAPTFPALIQGQGLPPSAARVLLATLQGTPAQPAPPDPAGALGRGAAAAGVRTPAQAAAFGQLAAAGLPTTPAAVQGLASLIEGAPVGRAVASLIGESAARAAAQPASGAPAAPAGQPAAGPPTPLAQTPQAAVPQAPSPGAVPTALPGAPGTPATQTPVALTGGQVPLLEDGMPGAPALPPSGGAPGQAPPPDAFGRLVAQLARLAESVSRGTTSGDPTILRAALADLGLGLEADLAAGRPAPEQTIRTHLEAIARQAADPALARAAERLADAIGAQALAGAALAPDSAAGNAAQQGAYLQLPLPGGQTAEVRVHPDAEGDDGEGGKRPRKVAFLLHLSALGAVLIETVAGPERVEAIVRVASAPARDYVAERVGDLAEALSSQAGSENVRVAVERFSGPPPARLLPPPPIGGLDVTA